MRVKSYNSFFQIRDLTFRGRARAPWEPRARAGARARARAGARARARARARKAYD